MKNRFTSYKLNRFLCVFTNPKSLIWLLAFNAVLVVILVFLSINDSFIEGVFVFLAVNAYLILDRFFHSPKALVLNNQTFEFSEYIHLKPKFSFVFIRGSFFWLRVNYTVSKIENLEFNQNSFEKAFDTGHISFNGKATFMAKRDLDRIPEKNTFAIYGIPHFSEFKAQLTNE